MNTSDQPNGMCVGHTLEDTINWSFGRISYWQTTSSGNLKVQCLHFFLTTYDVGCMEQIED